MLSLDSATVSLLMLTLLTGVSCQQLTPDKKEESSLEGSTVTLSYTYKVSPGDYFFWYRHYPGKAPEVLISHTPSGSVGIEKIAGLKIQVEGNQIKMSIISAAVTDSAVYYCAVQPTGGTGRLYFGKGTKLIVETGTEYKPAYFKVGEGENSACLATGFSKHNATNEHEKYRKEFNETKAVAISPNLDLYNQVIFPEDGGKYCEAGGTEGKCTDSLVPDEKVNLMSLTILGLRVIFIKTIIFNILLTLRLWISQ
ncbi:M1-specific T cell receptor alpha chain-like [Archocentrus centrarchus]|uniref:M1-specific T cell receptor alpha chain-like n=1 Tax=Archocentrus centrarchus TaxID=63155 RepID=UPI0011EA0569|nr:M1-specific T cell receptor alpha chain-like [Archocentrus centrarchus]